MFLTSYDNIKGSFKDSKVYINQLSLVNNDRIEEVDDENQSHSTLSKNSRRKLSKEKNVNSFKLSKNKENVNSRENNKEKSRKKII